MIDIKIILVKQLKSNNNFIMASPMAIHLHKDIRRLYSILHDKQCYDFGNEVQNNNNSCIPDLELVEKQLNEFKARRDGILDEIKFKINNLPIDWKMYNSEYIEVLGKIEELNKTVQIAYLKARLDKMQCVIDHLCNNLGIIQE